MFVNVTLSEETIFIDVTKDLETRSFGVVLWALNPMISVLTRDKGEDTDSADKAE